MDMTYDAIRATLKHCARDKECWKCILANESNCYQKLSRNVLDLLDRMEDTNKHRNTILQTVEAALDNGGYSVTVNPDGTVMLHPWQESAQWVAEKDRERHWHCSKCGYVTGLAVVGMQYCPRCGRYMENLDEMTSGAGGQAFSPD